MQAHLFGVRILGYGDYGENVTRQDGSSVEYVSLLDEETNDEFKLTLGPEVGDGRLDRFALADLKLEGRPEIKTGTGKDGRAFARPASIKWRVIGLTPGKEPTNSTPGRSGDKAAA